MEESSIILVKHAMPELDGNVPAKEWELGERGLKQAKKFANFVRDNLDVDQIMYSSPEPKAHATAKVMAESLGLELRVEDNLREFERPVLSIVSEEEHTDRNEMIFESPDDAVMGTESANQALARFEEGIKAVLKDPIEEERLVVCHGTVMSLFLAKHNEGVEAFDTWKKLGCPSYAVVSLPNFQILELNGKPFSN